MASPDSDAARLAEILLDAQNVVVLTGLRLGGVESRDLTHSAGRWAERASLEAFLTEPGPFWEYFYPTALTVAARAPEPVHDALARLQRAGRIGTLITQAVDRLHHRAGSSGVIEVFGTILTQRCERCGERYGLPEAGALMASSADGVPRCTTDGCGYPLRPAGTLWGEPLANAVIERAWEVAAEADAFVVLDSDLRTAPISLLPSVPLTRGVPLVIVGETPTQYDRYARMVVRTPSHDLLCAVADLIAPDA